MPLVARASTTVRNKNLLIILMCAAFLGWFAYDGFVKYPRDNDRLVDYMKSMVDANKLSTNNLPALSIWPGWNNATSFDRNAMTRLATEEAKVEGWHSETDMATQKYIVAGLAAAVAASIWWFFHCQARRVVADDTTVSPAKGTTIPWEKITIIDNTRWKSSGIVDITYLDDAGKPQHAKFDDYELEREPLLEILDQLAAKATHAELIPREDPAATEAPDASEITKNSEA